MQTHFRIAGGSIPGRDHLGRGRLLVGRNNQDASGWGFTEQALVAVVADGCGSGMHSEIGAHLGVRLLLTRLRHYLEQPDAMTLPHAELLEQAHADVVAQLRLLVPQLGESSEQVIREMLLFTLLGVLITPAQTVIFAIGDGVYALNGQVTQLGPFPGNAPPYLAYALLDAAACLPELWAAAQQFRIVASMPTAAVQSLLIGTDGLLDLIARAEQPLPGTDEPLGPLAQFWENEHYLDNPDAIRRRLVRANSQALLPDGRLAHGLLPDDTTLLVIRRCLSNGM